MSMRIGGLASGIDTDSIIKDMMRLERLPVDKMKQKQQTLEWQRDDYRSINTLLFNFSQKLLDMRLTSYYRSRTTSSTNESLVTATAANGAGKASYTISEVKQLATAGQKINAGKIGEKIDVNKGLYNSQGQFTNQNFDWKVGSVESKTIQVKEASNTFSLDLKESVQLTNTENMVVKVNGKDYQVVDAFSDLNANEVMIDTNGNLTFKDNVAANSTIKIDYYADKKIVDQKVSNKTTSINLGKGSLDAESISVTFNNKTYQAVLDNNTNQYHLRENGLEDGEDLGIINIENGSITLNQAIVKELDDGETVDLKAEFAQNYFTFGMETEGQNGVNKQIFAVQGNETMTNVMNKVNQSNLGATMFYDSHTGKVSVTRSETGYFGDDPIKMTGGFLNDVLRFGEEDTVTTIGQNAKFTINGLETERSSNTFTMNNVTFTLNKTFGIDGNTDTAQINVNNDNEKVFDNIVKFVEEYNKVVEEIQNKLQEQRYKDYPPLTDEQRMQLGDKQQEMWEEKAKSGLLRRDPMLTNALAEMRMSMYSKVDNPELEGVFNQLAQIGITTTANYMDGKLVINEEKLRAAINDNPEEVEKMFIGNGDSFGQKGIIHRLNENVTNTREKLRVKAGTANSVNHQFAIGKELDDIKSRIERFEERLKQIEARYWRQFTAMEKAIQRANEQSIYLMQQFSGM